MKIETRLMKRTPHTVEVRGLLFWLLSPVLVALLAAPLFVGHVAVRLLIARMRRRPDDLQSSTRNRTVMARTTRATWKSSLLRGLS